MAWHKAYTEIERQEICRQINEYLKKGYNDKWIANAVRVSQRTIITWRKKGFVNPALRFKGGKHAMAVNMDELLDSQVEQDEALKIDGTPKLERKEAPEYEYPEDDAWKYLDDNSTPQKTSNNVVQREVRLHGRFTSCNVVPENGIDMYYFDSAHIEIRKKDNAQDIVDRIDMMIKELQEMKMALCAGVYR